MDGGLIVRRLRARDTLARELPPATLLPHFRLRFVRKLSTSWRIEPRALNNNEFSEPEVSAITIAPNQRHSTSIKLDLLLIC